jgi:deoxycytidylate deaminase
MIGFRAASKEAVKSPHQQHKLGAVIVKGQRILASGYNSLRPSRLLKTPHLHAEAAAILKLLKERRLHDLLGAEIYVTRFTRGGSVGCSKPCPTCHNLIQSVGIKRIHFINEEGIIQTARC